MTTQNGRAFNEWLRAQLKAKKMSQRQLAQQSGVDHSTISRLIRGDRMPSLGTATKLARGLRELRDDADTPQYLGLVAAGNTNPTARVEYALRADELLSEPQVRQIMEYYLAVRMRRYGRTFQPSEVALERRSGARAGPPTLRLAEPDRGRGRVHRQHGAFGLALGRSRSGALLAHTRARPGFALHDPGLGAANAGVWGAGVRDSRGARASEMCLSVRRSTGRTRKPRTPQVSPTRSWAVIPRGSSTDPSVGCSGWTVEPSPTARLLVRRSGDPAGRRRRGPSALVASMDPFVRRPKRFPPPVRR